MLNEQSANARQAHWNPMVPRFLRAPVDGLDNLDSGKQHRNTVASARSNRPDTLTFVLPGIGAGGSEHVVTMLCNHFAGQGTRVRLICFEPAGTVPFYALDPGVTLVCLGYASRQRGGIASVWTMLQRYRLLRAEFRRARPQAVIAFLTRTNVLAAFAARALRIPVVVSERNNPGRQPVGIVWEWMRRRAYGKASGLVTMTRGAGRYFPKAAGRVDRVIPNHAQMPAQPTAFNPDGRRLVAVGRLVDQKGFDLLLCAFARIAADFPDWELVIWGDGPLRETLMTLRDSLGLRDRVAMPGITREPGGWITGTDLFVLSSRFEGWGLVVGEAMAAGIATVSFDCPFGPADMIDHGKTGLLARDQDVTALADAMAMAMADPELRQRMGAAARDAMKHYATDNILAQWDALIGDILPSEAVSMQGAAAAHAMGTVQ